jgi:hypothetical protein
MTKTNSKYIMIYRMSFAMELISKGHNVISTVPNPKNPRYTSWVFEKDDTFELDFQQLLRGGLRNETR